MRTSDSLASLAPAFVQAQHAIEVAKRDAANPFFKSKYADLEAVWTACRAALKANGLAVVQTLDNFHDPEVVVLTTRLLHSSGEWIEGSLSLRPTKADPQGAGSAITYARRYSLAAICGVVVEGEDDDANQASGGRQAGRSAPRPAARFDSFDGPEEPPIPYRAPGVEVAHGQVATKYYGAGYTEGQLRNLRRLIAKGGWDTDRRAHV